MRSHLFREYLEKEFLKENILICLSGAQMGWINEIKKMPKISLHFHFKGNKKLLFDYLLS